MNYWLLKSEPNTYSISDLERDGSTSWEGVRNYSARNNMRQMKVGDLGLYYHSNANPPGVAGICKIAREAYPDHYAWNKRSKYYAELLAIVLSGGAGLMLAGAIVAPGEVSCPVALKRIAPQAVQIELGCMVMLGVAGLIEGFVSPSALAFPARIMVLVGSLVGWTLYLVLSGRRANGARHSHAVNINATTSCHPPNEAMLGGRGGNSTIPMSVAANSPTHTLDRVVPKPVNTIRSPAVVVKYLVYCDGINQAPPIRHLVDLFEGPQPNFRLHSDLF